MPIAPDSMAEVSPAMAPKASHAVNARNSGSLVDSHAVARPIEETRETALKIFPPDPSLSTDGTLSETETEENDDEIFVLEPEFENRQSRIAAHLLFAQKTGEPIKVTSPALYKEMIDLFLYDPEFQRSLLSRKGDLVFIPQTVEVNEFMYRYSSAIPQGFRTRIRSRVDASVVVTDFVNRDLQSEKGDRPQLSVRNKDLPGWIAETEKQLIALARTQEEKGMSSEEREACINRLDVYRKLLVKLNAAHLAAVKKQIIALTRSLQQTDLSAEEHERLTSRLIESRKVLATLNAPPVAAAEKEKARNFTPSSPAVPPLPQSGVSRGVKHTPPQASQQPTPLSVVQKQEKPGLWKRMTGWFTRSKA